MLRMICFMGALMTLLGAAAPAFAQEEQGRSEASVQFMGTFIASTTAGGVTQSSSASGGVLATYRFFFDRYNGIEGNYSYSRDTTTYSLPDGQLGVEANLQEWSAAYVFRMPIHRIKPFAEAGVGELTFAPTNYIPVGSNQTRAAFVYGVGVDLNLGQHLFARAQYRGFVYGSPTFEVPFNYGLSRATHLAEPSIGLGFRF